ncbi:IS4 family transposase [Pleomorphomonas carboxyditropha]|uniref:Transposase IS4-like domain-containing protein n=1 Tax=Pleomorphomonas carboxyditropha TaxID=2023338 RepID=A0A2G9WWI7_9HYPH|nr:IS4 family transposase [Pleomorphomonas carboxyditropha]PIO99068.1 hypothetical protein CJ014_11360 [Pleomorphomonas carboxyditropha]
MTAVQTALMLTLSTHFALSKSRLSSLVALITGLAQSRTVNLSHLASHLPGRALPASHYRRLQRFFQFVRLDGDRLAVLVVQMLNLQRPKCLALDRTNWKIGSTDVNILMLAIVTRRFRVPLLWTLLPHQGCSDIGQRIALMRRYLALFDASSISMLVADREFIGAEWMDFLSENNIKFVIRAKIDMTMTLEDGRAWSFQSLLRRKRGRRNPAIGWGHLSGTFAPARHPVNFAAKRLKDNEWLIVVTNRDDPRQALNDYRKRWAIECLLEDTRIRSHDKLSCLLVVVTLAMVWAYRCATKTMGRKAIRRKTHGRREKSWFRIGLDALRNWISNAPENAADAWLHNAPNQPQARPKI